MNITRYLARAIKNDLGDRIILIGGPRQVGKTTLARSFISEKRQYFSWDDLTDRQVIKRHDFDPKLKAIVLDEIHKYGRWRMLLKGLFDKYREELKVVVTGSARLDHFRKGGDSLFGRYFYFRLHPLSISELGAVNDSDIADRLLRYSGFPEPYLKRNKVFHQRWQRERGSRVVNQDLRDLHRVSEVSLIELLVDMLPDKVGSLLSIKSLQEDLEVSPNTVSSWILMLENVYYCYRIPPYGSRKIRAVKKANKIYLWDWSAVPKPGPRFENFVASHLLKYCHWLEDTEGARMELRFLKDVDGREVDFVVLKDGVPIFAVESKTGEGPVSSSIRYFESRVKIPKFYQVHLGTKHFRDKNVEVLPFGEFCRIEGVP